jgi:hypothetical protein
MNEQTKAHLDKINNVNTSPELVAVIQYDEATKEAVCLLNNQTLETGDEVDYRGTKFPVVFAINSLGSVPDEIDHSVIDHYISTDAWDPIAKTIVTTSETVYGKKPGRTIVGADVVLTIGDVAIEQEPFYKGMGSHVICDDVTLDRFAFTVPNTVWGFREPKKFVPDE